VKMKPLPKILFVSILFMVTLIGIKAAVEHGFILTPGTIRAVTPQPTDNGVAPYTFMTSNGPESRWARNLPFAPHSEGDDALLEKYRQPDDTTGFPVLDNTLRYVWNNAGKLMLLFAVVAAMLIFCVERQKESHNDQMRREAEEREEAGADDIHDPFNAPEGMQPTSQYVPIRTRR